MATPAPKAIRAPSGYAPKSTRCFQKAGSPEAWAFQHSSAVLARVTGMAQRKENATTWTWARAVRRPAQVLMPSRESPGMPARAWPSPTAIPRSQVQGPSRGAGL